jgi:hypothetical protein
MFDLTQEVILEPIWQKRYQKMRWLLYFIFIIGGIYFAYRIFFPSQTFILNTTNRNTTSSTTLYDRGSDQGKEIFNAYTSENFSTATLQIAAAEDAPSFRGKKIEARKTYQAFAFPPDAQLVDSPADIPADGSFANGTLLSFDNSVFVVVGGKVMPFNNPITFLSFGYLWNDVIPATEAEIGLYQRDKLFTIDRPHPDGTVFLTRDSKKYFLIQDNQKKEIMDAEILKTYLQRTPIPVDEKSLDFNLSCVLKKNLWPLDSYSCSVPVENLAQFLGNDYQFALDDIDMKNIQQASLTLSRNVNWNNMRDTLSDIKHKAMLNYGLTTPN